MDINKISPGTEDELNVIIEIPKGSQNKYEFDKKNGIFALDRVLFSPMHYPGDYGFVPQTLCGDGDPLDALVFVNFSTFTGCLIRARPIGVLKIKDGGEEDDKLLCVPIDDPRMKEFKDLASVGKHMLDEIAHFFAAYKHLENKKVEILGWKGASDAKKVIKDAIALYKKQ